MKKLKHTALLLITILSFTACSSDDEKAPICDFGYEKDTSGECKIPWAQKFIKSNIPTKDDCSGNDNGVFLYNTSITMEDATTLVTRNFAGYTASNIIKMNVISSNEISFDYTDTSGRVFKGTGTKIGKELKIDFTVDFPTPGLISNTCSTVLTY